jgi:hypothetical protein
MSRRAQSPTIKKRVSQSPQQQRQPAPSTRTPPKAQAANSIAEMNRLKLQVETMAKEILSNTNLRMQMEILERERNFYFDKLREIEILCGHVTGPDGSGGKIDAIQLQSILWDRNEVCWICENFEKKPQFIKSSDTTGRTINRSGGGTSGASPQPHGDAIPPPLDSPDERQLHQMMDERKQCLSQQSNKNDGNENESQQGIGQQQIHSYMGSNTALDTG